MLVNIIGGFVVEDFLNSLCNNDCTIHYSFQGTYAVILTPLFPLKLKKMLWGSVLDMPW